MIEPPLWHDGASAFPHEREALAFLKARLAGHEPYRAWTNEGRASAATGNLRGVHDLT